jgi:hypothetical protein
MGHQRATCSCVKLSSWRAGCVACVRWKCRTGKVQCLCWCCVVSWCVRVAAGNEDVVDSMLPLDVWHAACVAHTSGWCQQSLVWLPDRACYSACSTQALAWCQCVGGCVGVCWWGCCWRLGPPCSNALCLWLGCIVAPCCWLLVCVCLCLCLLVVLAGWLLLPAAVLARHWLVVLSRPADVQAELRVRQWHHDAGHWPMPPCGWLLSARWLRLVRHYRAVLLPCCTLASRCCCPAAHLRQGAAALLHTCVKVLLPCCTLASRRGR